MAANPNPTRISAAEWRLWEECLAIIPGVRLSGIYANKSGYHNFVYANQASWPGNYSIRLSWDLQGDLTKARAIDLTMSTAEMIKRTGYMRASALHPQDNRLSCVREFIGTLDGKTVFALIRDSPTGPWRSSSADTTHLWHEHDSFFTLYCDDWDARPGVPGLEAVLSVKSGESWEAWVARKSGTVPIGGSMLCKRGDKGPIVESMQELILKVDPAALPQFGSDADYGGETASGLVRVGATANGDPTGNNYGPVEYANLLALVAKKQGGAGVPGPQGPPGPAGPAGPKGDDGLGVGDSFTATVTTSSTTG